MARTGIGVQGTAVRVLIVSMCLCGVAAYAQSPLSTLRPTPRVFFLPTANAIGAGHGFISDYELFALYGGVGIGDVVSVTAGTTLVPLLAFSSQISTAQVKATFVQDDGFAMALGGSVTTVSSANTYSHLFINSSLLVDSTWYTLAFYYKLGGPDFAAVDAAPFGNFAFSYTGSLGIAFGVDIAVRNHADMHIVAELWNHDVANPRHTMILGGMRIGNDVLSGTFGLVFTPVPFIFPMANFSYEW